MNRRRFTILGILLLVAFAGFSLLAFRDAMTPYVSFAQAQEMPRTVQVAGGLEKDSTRYDPASELLEFTLFETASTASLAANAEGAAPPPIADPAAPRLKVRYRGVRPANFEDAISIVAIGRFDAAASEFEATKLLVKCPSKYQGAEVRSYS